MRNQSRFGARPFRYPYIATSFAIPQPQGFSRNDPDQIRWLQGALNRALGLQLRVNGVMGLRTRKALREFQRRSGLPIDGMAGAETQQALIAATGAPPIRRQWFPSQFEPESFNEYEQESEARPPAKPKCRKDHCGAQYVRWLQKSLNQVLGLRLGEDGVSGRGALSAIRSFQQKHGLKVDGDVGPLTEQALVAAGAGQPPQAKEMPCGKTGAQEMIRLLKKHGRGLPVDFLLGWIEVESNFRIDSSTYLCERGYFQIHPDQSKDFGYKHELISFDPDYSVQCGIDLVLRAVRAVEPLAQKYGISKQSDAFWGLVKLYHWIPSAPRLILARMQQRGDKPASWAAIASRMAAPPRLIPGFDSADGVRNVDASLKAMKAWRQRIDTDKSLSQETENELENGGAAPQLIKSEPAPPSQTLYVKITLGAERPAKAMTGIFVPENFKPTPQVDVIIYLHGIKVRADLTIDQYWDPKRYAHFALREKLNAGRRNAILIAPTLGPQSQWQTGWLTKPGGLDRYLEQVLAALVANGPYRGSKPRIGNIILACHSGGGRPMRELALAQNHCAQNIKECWGFDCTYYGADPTGWPKWARSRPDAKLYLYYRPGTRTAINSKKIQALKLPNVVVATSPVGHNWVPIKHWQERVEQSPSFRPLTGAGTAREYWNPHFWTPEGESELEGVQDEYYAGQQEFESEVRINVDSAVRKNREFAPSVGWAPHMNAIAARLLGITAVPPDEAAFAHAVAEWQQRNRMSADGVIGKGTWSEMAFNLGLAPTPAPRPPAPEVNTLIAKSALGFCGRGQARRYGLPETILALTQVGMLWFARHPTGPRILIGDISQRGGGKISPHKSHRVGLDMDISLMRNDGKEEGVKHYKTDPSYSRTLTQELVDTFRNNGVLPVKCIFFNDPAVTGVRPESGHNNHLHVRFCMPARYKGVLRVEAAYPEGKQASYLCPPYKC